MGFWFWILIFGFWFLGHKFLGAEIFAWGSRFRPLRVEMEKIYESLKFVEFAMPALLPKAISQAPLFLLDLRVLGTAYHLRFWILDLGF